MKFFGYTPSVCVTIIAILSQQTIAFTTPYHSRCCDSACQTWRTSISPNSRGRNLQLDHNPENENVSSVSIQQLEEQLQERGDKTSGGKDESAPNNNGTSKPFLASPVTLMLKKSPDPSKESVNFATLRFNAKLNEMSKNVDSSTAAKVESLLLNALAKYEEYLTANPENPNPRDVIVPNTVSFTNAITAWARNTRKDSPYKAEALLDKMHSLYSRGEQWKHVKPNKISYNSVINAWAKSADYKSGKRAEKLFFRMFDFYKEEGEDDELRPDARSFNSVINAGEFWKIVVCRS